MGSCCVDYQQAHAVLPRTSDSSLLHNSVGGGTVQSAGDHLIKFLLLQARPRVPAVMFTQEAQEHRHMIHTATLINGLGVINLHYLLVTSFTIQREIIPAEYIDTVMRIVARFQINCIYCVLYSSYIQPAPCGIFINICLVTNSLNMNLYFSILMLGALRTICLLIRRNLNKSISLKHSSPCRLMLVSFVYFMKP